MSDKYGSSVLEPSQSPSYRCAPTSGAPYLPTKKANRDLLFEALTTNVSHCIHRNDVLNVEAKRAFDLTAPPPSSLPSQKDFRAMQKLRRHETSSAKKLTFVDLGSGDGRLVIHAARSGLFDRSVGLEINPLLVLYSHVWRMTSRQWETSFVCRDIWKADLRDVDVVAVVSETRWCATEEKLVEEVAV